MFEGFYCPYCQHLHENWWEYAPTNEKHFFPTCEACEKHLVVRRLDSGVFESKEIWNAL